MTAMRLAAGWCILLFSISTAPCGAEFEFGDRYYKYVNNWLYRTTAGYRLTDYMRKMAVYKRIYSPRRLGQFYNYHKMYYYHSRTSVYSIRIFKKYSFDCSNFEANNQSDYLGYFYCPLPFEPLNYSKCCGDDKYQYCCLPDKPSDSETWWYNNSWKINVALATVLPGLFLLGVISGLIFLYQKKRSSRRHQTGASPPNVALTPSLTNDRPSAPPPSTNYWDVNGQTSSNFTSANPQQSAFTFSGKPP